MQISALRDDVSQRLCQFAWDEWAQMGLLAPPRRESPWAADPEAHLLFTLQIARSDPRLYEEILDWLAHNASLLSAQRFRNHYASETDERLGEAALAWLVKEAPVHVQPRRRQVTYESETLFYGAPTPGRFDGSFAEYGLLKPATQRSRKSRHPDLAKPINFAFRLRSGFGVGSRAEVMRFLLTASGGSPLRSRPLFTTLAIAQAAGFRKRNVQETLNALAAAGWLEHVIRGREHLYTIEPDRWRSVAWSDALPFPSYRDWTHTLQGLAELHRWLNTAEIAALTPYMLASEARRKVTQIAPSLSYAGLPAAERQSAEGAAFWAVFVTWVEQILSALESGSSW